MWGNSLVSGHGSRTRLAVLSLVVAIMAVGALFAVTAGHPDRPGTEAATKNSPDYRSAGPVDVERLPADAQTSDAGVKREAAAGPDTYDARSPDRANPPAEEQLPPLNRVGIQAGHWKNTELPEELERIRAATGTTGGGVDEWELNLDIATRVAGLLEGEGLTVDIIPATVPPGYRANAFVALHADGDDSGTLYGFKIARARRSAIPNTDDALLAAISESYQSATSLAIDTTVSRNMTGYYAFNYRRFEHAIAPNTPAVILEMGFLTNASDRLTILGKRETVAEGIATGILRFLAEERSSGG